MRLLWLLLVGCAASPPAPRIAAFERPAAPRELVAEPARSPPAPARASREVFELDGRGRPVEDIILLEPTRARFRGERTVSVADIDMLSRCARDVVHTVPESARRSVVTALLRYQTTCDAEGRVILERPLDSDRNDRRTRTHASFVGWLAPNRIELSLRVAFCGGDSASPDHVALVAEDLRWVSPRLEFRRDASMCDVAELPFTSALGRALETAMGSPGAKLVFEGTHGELLLDDALEAEFRLVLDAHAAFTSP